MLGQQPLQAFVATTRPEAARRFYGEVLGLDLQHADEFGLEFDAGGTPLRIARVNVHTPAAYTVLGWRVSDITGVVQALMARGVTFERFAGLGDQDQQGVWRAPDGARVAWFRDPDHNLLSLTQPASSPAVSVHTGTPEGRP